MNDRLYYNVRYHGERIIIMSGHVPEPVIADWPEYTHPAQLAEDANGTVGYKARHAEIVTHAQLEETKAGREALRWYYEGDNSAWHESAIAEMHESVEATLTDLQDEDGDDFARFVLEEGSLGEKLRYAHAAG